MASRGRLGFWLRVTAPVLASIAGLATLRLLGPDVVSRETLQGVLAPLGAFAPVGFVLLLGMRPLTLLPGQLFTAVGGILFGVVWASVYGMVGSLLGGLLVFLLARKLGTRFMKRLARDRYPALRLVARRHDFKVMALVTLNPLFPTDVVVALAGATGARLVPTLGGLLLGTLPGTVLTAQFGAALGSGRTLLSVISAAGVLLTMVLGVVLGRRIYADFGEAANGGGAPGEGPGRRPAGRRTLSRARAFGADR